MHSSSSIQMQRIAFHTAMDKYIPLEYRHKIALYANDSRRNIRDIQGVVHNASQSWHSHQIQ
jgi:hypothetical protein